MSNKMLIDASHPEETRVVVTKGNRIEEFDFESEHKKQLKGNIYLARVTRVEPSLQAAFVEYGGNRHGFLAFSEIHPDYYQIPVADRQALLEAEESNTLEDAAAEHDSDDAANAHKKGKSRRRKSAKAVAHSDSVSEECDESSNLSHEADEDGAGDEKPVDLVGVEDALEEVPVRDPDRRATNWRDYKIQEVIKRRQILLVQIVKEERGNKGAALTTYLSLAGRYSVLMPNTARGGGISRKITNITDRKRLKDIVKDLSIPRGMGIILRTAGAARTKTEVRRDYEYLMRLWENVRNLTLTSMAPALVYEEGSLIKRSIRDLYNKDIDEILVAGDKAYREAKDFMRMLMPSHAKFVQPYRDQTPIFARRGIEAQLDGMLQPEVGLKSGGYLVMNQTEALVAIDVNSGRSTREYSVEETALQTNLEAAEEVARQLRLRDLAGLIVIDFIDMQEKRNIRAVEKRLKDCLKDDRARIQIGHISHFGLMEMSRQRIRASVLESTTQPCPHCFGRGYVRSQSSLALHVLRVIEEYLQRSSSHNIMVKTPVSTALYVLNHKRRALNELEERFGLIIDIEADDNIGKEHLTIQKTLEVAARNAELPDNRLVTEGQDLPADEADKMVISKSVSEKVKFVQAESAVQTQKQRPTEQDISVSGNEDSPKRRRRRGRRGGRRSRESNQHSTLPAAEPIGPFAMQFSAPESGSEPAEKGNSRNIRLEAEPVGSFADDKRGKRQKNPGRGRNRAVAKSAAEPQKSDQDKSAKRKDELKRKHEGAEKHNNTQKQRGSKKAQSHNHADNPKDEKSADKTEKSTKDMAVDIGYTAKDKNAYKQKNSNKAAQAGEQIITEPVVTSSVSEGEKANMEKKKGWWGRRNFF